MNKSCSVTVACVLFLVLSLSACTTSTFPTGTFEGMANNDRVLEFTDDGTFTYSSEGEIITSGTYSIRGNEVTWEEDDFCDDLFPDSDKSTYTWSYENGILTFVLEGEDDCEGRRNVLNNVRYEKVSS